VLHTLPESTDRRRGCVSEHAPYVDTLVREYLLRRGCVGALSAFDTECVEEMSVD